MKGLGLNRLVIVFAAGIFLALSCNAWILVSVLRLHTETLTQQQSRQRSLQISSDIEYETAWLSRMVRAYTTSAETKYLNYYYDIIDIRQGKKAAPQGYGPRYWAEVMAGDRPHAMAENRPGISIQERMRAQGFSRDEFAAMDRILACSTTLFEQDQIAFAATQGLYDPIGKKFTDEGKPQLRFANSFVYSDSYLKLENALLQEVQAFARLTDDRTHRAVQHVSAQLSTSIYTAIVIISITLVLVLFSMGVIFRKVLSPLRSLTEKAIGLGAGDYSIRSDTGQGVLELQALEKTFNIMADNIQEDIARRENISRDLELASAKAEESTKAKSMFLANMSHEIRTPMNAIVGMTYLALTTDLSPRQQDYLGKIQNAAQSLLGVINDILDFTKIEAGKLELEKVEFQIEALAKGVLTLVRQSAEEKGIELLLSVREPRLQGSAGTFLGDPLRLEQVLSNLLSNAVKFTDKGYVQLGIEERHRTAAASHLQLTVADTGIGMTPEEIDRLFQEFSQADGSTTRRHGGTGLGLAITKRILGLMGGEILVTSEPGRGTIFTCYLSLERVEMAGRHRSQPKNFASGESTAKSHALPSDGEYIQAAGEGRVTRLQGMRVLLVEDNQVNQEIAAEILAYHGAEVDLAQDGKEALDTLAAKPDDYYHAVLMDIQMPVMDGYEATGKLRAQSRYASLPIIAMTAHAMVEEQERCAALGMNAHVAKPFKMEELLATLSAFRPTLQEGVAPLTFAVSEGESISDGRSFLPQAVPGIDLGEGLLLCAGRVEIYSKVLQGYLREYRGLVEALRFFLANEQWKDLTRLAHSFKGLSGTIGARALRELGERIEKAGIVESSGTAGLLAELEKSLAPVLDALKSHFDDRSKEEEISGAAMGEDEEPFALLEQLRYLLAESDSAVLDFWERQQHVLRKILSPALVVKIDKKLDAFQFDEALALLSSLADKGVYETDS